MAPLGPTAVRGFRADSYSDSYSEAAHTLHSLFFALLEIDVGAISSVLKLLWCFKEHPDNSK